MVISPAISTWVAATTTNLKQIPHPNRGRGMSNGQALLNFLKDFVIYTNTKASLLRSEIESP